jgi:hypothetical protein
MEEDQAEDDFAASARLRDGLSWSKVQRIRGFLCGGME